MLNNYDPILLFPEGQDKETFLALLKELYLKNKSIYTLVEKFGLIWECHPLDERLNTIEILEYLDSLNININQNQKQTTKMGKTTNSGTIAPTKTVQTSAPVINSDPFANLKPVVSNTDFDGFLNFEVGETQKLFLIGSLLMAPKDGEAKTKRFLAVDSEGDVLVLPAHQKLVNKLNFIEQGFGGKLSKENAKPVVITLDGMKPHPTKPEHTIAEYTVLG